MAEEWREFEELVSRIERVLGPIGAVVTSPDRIRDSITGQLREVDASIRPQRDAPPIRVLECRDRAGVQDVTWIEQIIGKTLGHGVPTIAVSSTGFSKSAIAKANHYGIEARVISTFTQEELTGWVKIARVEHAISHQTIERVFVRFHPEPEDSPGNIDLHPSVCAELQAGGGDAPIFLRVEDGRKFKCGEILDMLIRNGQIRIPDASDNCGKLHTFIINMDRGLCRIQTVKGLRDVSRLEITCRLSVETVSSPLPEKAFSYHGSVRPTVYGIETQAEVLGNPIVVSIHREPGSNMFAVTVTKKDEQ